MANGEEEFIASLREDGVMDWVEDRVREGLHHEQPAEDSIEETTTTGEQPRDPETGQFVSASEAAETEIEEPAETEQVDEEHPEDLEQEADDELFLDLTPEKEEWINKYGSLDKAIEAGMWADSVRGRQGNELGERRQREAELEARLAALEQQRLQAPVSYPEFPDIEYEEPEVAVPRLREIAERAFQYEDVDTMQHALHSWQQIDPLGAEAYASLKAAQMVLLQSQAQPREEIKESTVEAEFAKLEARIPDIKQHGDAIAAEAERWPTLARRLQEGTPQERVQALEDLYLEAKRRTSSENAEQAMRRVRVRQSEEARRVRQEAQVVTGKDRRVVAEEPTERKVRLGDTGYSIDLNRVDELIAGDMPADTMVMRGGRLGRIVDGKFVPSS